LATLSDVAARALARCHLADTLGHMAHEGSTLADTAVLLGIKGPVLHMMDLLPVVRRGLPSSALGAVAKRMDLTVAATFEPLGLAKRTIARRVQSRQRLSRNESELVLRLARGIVEATAVLGTLKKAQHWLQSPSRALGGAVPLQLLDTDVGAEVVREELGRIEHGVFA
jgi:putative toxin-antitoxin system antitoxin component (TIGR02293 family)